MKICLIGNGITNLLLAKCLLKRNFLVHLYDKYKKPILSHTRTIAISDEYKKFINKHILINNKLFWSVNSIKIYNENNSKIEVLNFSNKNKNSFFMVKNLDFYKKLYQSVIKNKKFKKKTINEKFFLKIIKNKEYDLIINSQVNNEISKKYFNKRIEQDTKSFALTSIIKHKKVNNQISRQIFTKNGPLAFLPLSKFETSLVYSINNKNINFSDKEIIQQIEKYNKFYNIYRFQKFEKFKITFSQPRNFYFKNVLLFGDGLHKIHPLTGQAFNMTIRDIKNLLGIIDEKIKLGLSIDNSVLYEFENNFKSKNFLFAKGIEVLNSFFKIDNKFNNNISNKLFPLINTNQKIKNIFTTLANKGF